MGPITALLLATPIFGFALAPPEISVLPGSTMSVAVASASSAPVLAGGDASPMIAVSEPSATALASSSALVTADASALTAVAQASAAPSQAEYTAAVRKRAKLAKIHRTLGIATWTATLLAVASGTVAYRNLYGVPLSTELNDTPCVTGEAWFGQKTCFGQPWGHAILGFGAGAFYFTTLGLAIGMPDPDNASVGTSTYARTLRMHKLLRWVHLAGMVSQMVIGTIIANPKLTGLDRANDYGTLKALGGLHLGSGYIALGALTWAGSIMLF